MKVEYGTNYDFNYRRHLYHTSIIAHYKKIIEQDYFTIMYLTRDSLRMS